MNFPPRMVGGDAVPGKNRHYDVRSLDGLGDSLYPSSRSRDVGYVPITHEAGSREVFLDSTGNV
jgi:hypothetical protein